MGGRSKGRREVAGRRIWTIGFLAVTFVLLLVAATLNRCAMGLGCPSSIVEGHLIAKASRHPVDQFPPGTTVVTPNEMHSWDIAKDGDRKAYAAGGLVVTLGKGKDADGSVAPEIAVKSADGRVGHAVGQTWADDKILADFGIGKIDPDNETSEVVFATYSGGAHCCTDAKILALTKSGWTVLDLGAHDGDTPLFPEDVNGTSTRAFVLYDDRFLYAFASHADSFSPPLVFVIRDAKLVDESASGKYRAVYEKDLKETESACRRHQNGGCAGFVADAARLGRDRFEKAWAVMLENYDKSDTWELPADCDVEPDRVTGQCPKGHERKFDNYPDALRAFLVRNGYIPS